MGPLLIRETCGHMCEAIAEVTSGEAEHELINVYDTSAYSLTFCFRNELGLLLRIIKIIHECELLIKPELHQHHIQQFFLPSTSACASHCLSAAPCESWHFTLCVPKEQSNPRKGNPILPEQPLCPQEVKYIHFRGPS